MKTDKELSFYDQMELGKVFVTGRDRFNANCGSKAMVTAKTGTGRIKFSECGESLHEESFC